MWKLIRRRVLVTAGLLTTFVMAGVLLVFPAPTSAQGVGGSGLSPADLNAIIAQAVAAANSTSSPLRSHPGVPRTTKMHIAIVGRNGKLLAHFAMPDAWVGSEDIAIAKARTAAFFSSDENALTSRIIGVLSKRITQMGPVARVRSGELETPTRSGSAAIRRHATGLSLSLVESPCTRAVTWSAALG